MDPIRLAGLWKNADKKDNTYLSGNLNAITRVTVMPNENKKTDRDPDYFLYISPKEKGKARTKTEDSVSKDGYYYSDGNYYSSDSSYYYCDIE